MSRTVIDKALLKKIRKCLALAKSANEHEAAAALAKARELMDAHGVDEAQVGLAEFEEATARAGRAARPPQWENILCATVRRAFSVTAIMDERHDRTYIGRGPSAEIAAYAFSVLYRQLKRELREYILTRLKRCGPARKRQRADIFCEGWAHGAYSKIAALVPKAEPDPAVRQYLAVTRGEMTTVGARQAKVSGKGAAEDWFVGRNAGRSANLHGGVSGSAAPLQLGAGA